MVVPTFFVFVLMCLVGVGIVSAIRIRRQDHTWSEEDLEKAHEYALCADDQSESIERRSMFQEWSQAHYEGYTNNRGSANATLIIIVCLIAFEAYLTYLFIFQTNW